VLMPMAQIFTTGRIVIAAVVLIISAYWFGRVDGRKLAESNYNDNVIAAEQRVRKEEQKIAEVYAKQNRQLQADYNKLQNEIAVKGSKLDDVFEGSGNPNCVLTDDQLRALEDAAAGSQRRSN
jgi:predicted DNA binding protein